MKRILSLSLFILALFSSQAKAQLVPDSDQNPASRLKGLTSTIVGSYPQQVDWFNWTASSWAADKVQKITYNQFGDPLTVEMDYISGTDQKTTYTYNAARQPVLALKQESSAGSWVNVSRERTEYDANNFPTLEIQEAYQGGTWVITDGVRYEIIAQNALLQQMIVSEYNLLTGQYVLNSRITYSYGTGGVLSTMTIETRETGSWVNSVKMTYTWVSRGKTDIIIMEGWENGQWIKAGKYTYTWGNFDSYTMIYGIWNAGLNDYSPFMRNVSQLDSHKNLILQTGEMWMGTSWFQSTGSQYDIVYLGDHATQRITKQYKAGTYSNSTKEVFSGFINLGIDDPTDMGLSFSVYPNPAVETITIQYTSFGSVSRTIELVDVNGKILRIESPQLAAKALTWDLSGISSGVYLIRMSDNTGQVVIKRIIKE